MISDFQSRHKVFVQPPHARRFFAKERSFWANKGTSTRGRPGSAEKCNVGDPRPATLTRVLAIGSQGPGRKWKSVKVGAQAVHIHFQKVGGGSMRHLLEWIWFRGNVDRYFLPILFADDQDLG